MKKEIKVGDIETVDFIKNEKGGKPVCRINGRVAFIDNKVKSFVAPCSTWVVEVSVVNEKVLCVVPLFKERTAKQNQVIFKEKLQELKQMPKQHKKKEQKVGQYLSFQELKAIKTA